jgi:hypothetical protein
MKLILPDPNAYEHYLANLWGTAWGHNCYYWGSPHTNSVVGVWPSSFNFDLSNRFFHD